MAAKGVEVPGSDETDFFNVESGGASAGEGRGCDFRGGKRKKMDCMNIGCVYHS